MRATARCHAPAAGGRCPLGGCRATSTTPNPGAGCAARQEPVNGGVGPSIGQADAQDAGRARILVRAGERVPGQPIGIMDLAVGVCAGDQLPGLDEVALHGLPRRRAGRSAGCPRSPRHAIVAICRVLFAMGAIMGLATHGGTVAEGGVAAHPAGPILRPHRWSNPSHVLLHLAALPGPALRALHVVAAESGRLEHRLRHVAAAGAGHRLPAMDDADVRLHGTRRASPASSGCGWAWRSPPTSSRTREARWVDAAAWAATTRS